MRNIDQFRGCLIGGAIGDALGYPIEFLDETEIKAQFGETGLTSYVLQDGVAQISDDTQMTLFTANGLLLGTTRGRMRGIKGSYPSYIYLCYQDWLYTQESFFRPEHVPSYSWLANLPELHAARAPGNTCLSALSSGKAGTISDPINDSKGCGGIMRVAPIGLYFDTSKPRGYSREEVAMMGAETAALTHGHELGYIPAAALVHIINNILYVGCSGPSGLHQAIVDAIESVCALFKDKAHIHEFKGLMDQAVNLAYSEMVDLDCLHRLGEGWVAEETLAVAIFCALRYQEDVRKALLVSVNHDGDSDSTGAVTGNLLGAYHGLRGLPAKFLERLELKNRILEIADDLFYDCRISEYGEEKVWMHKYIRRDYPENPKMVLRPERPEDYFAVEQLTFEAFLGIPHAGGDEALLANKMRKVPGFVAELDFVAEIDGRVVGNILYTKSKVVGPDGEWETLTFGPLSVSPGCQRQGIGDALVRHTLAIARRLGYRAVLIFGHEEYYPRFGFINAETYGITTADGQNFPAFMALPLYDGALDGISGKLCCDPVFEQLDQAEAEAFNLQFSHSAKEKADL